MSDPNVVEYIKSEFEDDYSDDDIYRIKSWGADMSFRELTTMFDEEELVKPEIQRNYVWDKNEASRFIDSILLGLPVPSIFLANDPENNKIIVDGYQRIMTVYDYMRGVWSGDNKIFRLSRSAKVNPRWAGKAYTELDAREQKKIKSTTIHAIVFEQSHPKEDDTSLYQIFERINTSGRTLTPQEIRNCVYQGDFNRLLIKLNKDKNWRMLFGTIKPEPRMRDIEYILRFFLMLQPNIRDRKDGKMLLKKELNLFMGAKENNSKSVLKRYENEFTKTMAQINNVLGSSAFRRIHQDNEIWGPFHPTIFDSIATCAAIYLRSHSQLPNNLVKRKIKLLEDKRYIEFTSTTTTKYLHISGRFNRTNTILFSK